MFRRNFPLQSSVQKIMPEGKNQGEREEYGRSRKGYRSVVDLFVEWWKRKLWGRKKEGQLKICVEIKFGIVM